MKEDLRKKYESLSTIELLRLQQSEDLTEIGRSLLAEVLSRRDGEGGLADPKNAEIELRAQEQSTNPRRLNIVQARALWLCWLFFRLAALLLFLISFFGLIAVFVRDSSAPQGSEIARYVLLLVIGYGSFRVSRSLLARIDVIEGALD